MVPTYDVGELCGAYTFASSLVNNEELKKKIYDEVISVPLINAYSTISMISVIQKELRPLDITKLINILFSLTVPVSDRLKIISYMFFEYWNSLSENKAFVPIVESGYMKLKNAWYKDLQIPPENKNKTILNDTILNDTILKLKEIYNVETLSYTFPFFSGSFVIPNDTFVNTNMIYYDSIPSERIATNSLAVYNKIIYIKKLTLEQRIKDISWDNEESLVTSILSNPHLICSAAFFNLPHRHYLKIEKTSTMAVEEYISTVQNTFHPYTEPINLTWLNLSTAKDDADIQMRVYFACKIILLYKLKSLIETVDTADVLHVFYMRVTQNGNQVAGSTHLLHFLKQLRWFRKTRQFSKYKKLNKQIMMKRLRGIKN